MNEQMLQHLESCAQLLMAPTNLVNREELKEAEEAFLRFQRTKEPFEVCRRILESGECSPYLKYQAGTCLKNSIIRDWGYLKEEGRHVQLLHYLLEYVTNHPPLSHFIREQLLLVAAILLKRIGIQESGAKSRLADEGKEDASIVSSVLSSVITMQSTLIPSILNQGISSILTQGNPPIPNQGNPPTVNQEEVSVNLHRMLIATQYLLAVLFEYSSSTRTSDFGIPWIKHLEAKKRFERRELKEVFRSTLDTLNSILTHLHPLLTCHDATVQSSSERALPGLASDLYLKSLELLEMMFTWNFDIITIISSQYATHVDSIETPSFQPSVEWREILIQDHVIHFLFHLYHFSKTQVGNEKMVHHSLQSLSQLSTLTGPIICDSTVRLRFVNLLLSGLINIMPSHSSFGSQELHSFGSQELHSSFGSNQVHSSFGSNQVHSSFESYEVVAISSIIYRLSFHLQNRDTLDHIDPCVKIQLADIVTTISCEIFLGNLRLDQDRFASEDGADRYRQGVENICTAWSVLLQTLEKNSSEETYSVLTSSFEEEKSPGEGREGKEGKESSDVEIHMLRSSARKVFTCYLKCHLTQPEGYREMVEERDEIEEFEEDDTAHFNDQLNTIGTLGRIDLSNAVDDLSNLLMIRMNQLDSMLHSLLSRPEGGDNNNASAPSFSREGAPSLSREGAHSLTGSTHTLGSHSLTGSTHILGSHSQTASSHTLGSHSQTASSHILGSQEWCALNEDLHWLILISSWTLSQSTWLGDRDLIPDAVTALSLQVNGDISLTLAALKSLDINPHNVHSVDPVVRLIIILFRLVRMEEFSIENNLNILSPEVSSTLSLFISKFMSVYLMPREDSYKEMSITLVSCFGKDTQSGVEILDFLLKHLLMKMTAWSTEGKVREETGVMLVQFVKESRERASAVGRSGEMKKILIPLFSNQIQCFTVGTRRSLYQLVVILAVSHPSLYSSLFSSLRSKFLSTQSLLRSQEDLNELNRIALCDLCDSLIGITHASTPENSGRLWNEILGGIYVEQLPRLMEMYRNYHLVISSLLQLTHSLTARLLCFLPSNQSLLFYHATVKILHIYASSNQGRSTADLTAMEETAVEIVLILQTLNDLSSKDFIDWFPPVSGSGSVLSSGSGSGSTLLSVSGSTLPAVTEEADEEISATQIVFLGLNILLPFLTPQLLQFPDLSVNYYKLVTYLCEDADRLVQLPDSLLHSLMLSLQHALKSTFSSDIKCSCLSTIYVLTEHCLRSEAKGLSTLRQVALKLEPFLELIFTMVIEEQGSTRDVLLREHVANCLFSLIKCFPNSYQTLIERLIKSQVASRPNEPNLESDLRSCFSNLTTPSAGDSMTTSSFSRLPHRTLNSVQGLVSFRQRFEVIICELLGLLRIK